MNRHHRPYRPYKLRAPEAMPARVRSIFDEIAKRHGFDPDDLLTIRSQGSRRHYAAIAARDEIAYAIYHTPTPGGRRPGLVQIGSWLGRDHSIIHVSIKRHAARLAAAEAPIAA